MTAPPQMNGAGPMLPQPQMLPNGQTAEDPALVTQALLKAARTAAEKSLTAQGQDSKDFGTASLNFVQALIVLDPSLSQGGTPLEHDVALKRIDQETQAIVADTQRRAAVEVADVNGHHALRKAQATAAAPTPSKKITINRSNGGTTQAEVSG